jgi:hypothetical protein
MSLLNTFFEWFTNHRLAGEMIAIAILVILIGSWVGIAYLKYKKELLKKEAMKKKR